MTIPKELMDKFIESSNGRMGELERLLDELAKNPADKALYDQLYQMFHKYHGASAMYGFEGVGLLSGIVENFIAEVVSKDLVIKSSVVGVLVNVKDLIKKGLHEQHSDIEGFEGIEEELKKSLENSS